MLDECLEDYTDSFRSISSMVSPSDFWLDEDKYRGRDGFNELIRQLFSQLNKLVKEDKRRYQILQRRYGISESMLEYGAIDELMKGGDRC